MPMLDAETTDDLLTQLLRFIEEFTVTEFVIPAKIVLSMDVWYSIRHHNPFMYRGATSGPSGGLQFYGVRLLRAMTIPDDEVRMFRAYDA